MRTAKMTIDGREHLLCFSGRVLRNVTEKFGGVREMYEAFSCKDQAARLDAAIWALAQMVDAGDRYAQLNGMPNPGRYTPDDLYDLIDINDFAGLYSKIRDTITGGSLQKVGARPQTGGRGKKAEATPEACNSLLGA